MPLGSGVETDQVLTASTCPIDPLAPQEPRYVQEGGWLRRKPKSCLPCKSRKTSDGRLLGRIRCEDNILFKWVGLFSGGESGIRTGGTAVAGSVATRWRF